MNTLITTSLIIPIAIIIAVVAIIVLIAVISYHRSAKVLYKKLIKSHEYNHELLTNQLTKYMSRIQTIASKNRSYVETYNSLSSEYQEATRLDKVVKDLINDLKEDIDSKNYRQFKSILKANRVLINNYNNYVSHLNTELSKLLRQEIEISNERKELIEKYKEIKANYKEDENKLSYVDDSFKTLFKVLKSQFVKVNEKLDYADYEEAKERLAIIKSALSDLPTIAKELPSIIERSNVKIPSKLKELERKYNELVQKNFPLANLNVDSVIKSIKKSLHDVDNTIKDLEIKGLTQILDNIESKIDELMKALIEEEKAKKEFDASYSQIVDNINKTEQEYLLAKPNIEKFQQIYRVNQEHQAKLASLKASIDKIAIDKRNIELQLNYNGQNPYSYILNVAKGLDENAKNTRELLKDIKSYQLASKEICENAYALLEPTYHKVKLFETKLNALLQPQIEETYKPIFDKTYQLMEKINTVINDVPIDVKTVEDLSSQLLDIKEKQLNEINTLLVYQEKAKNSILLINRVRMHYSDINALLIQAEKHYTQGEYKLAFDLTSFIVEKLNSRAETNKKQKKTKKK